MKIIISFLMVLSFGSFASASDLHYGPDDWEQYRFHTSNNAVYSNGDPRSIEQIYSTGDEVRSNPVIVRDSLYVGNHNSGDLYSFDLFSGEINWKSSVPNWIHADTIYHDGLLYVGYGNRKFKDPFKQKVRGTGESGVAAFQAQTGEKVWEYKTEGEVMPAPAYYKGNVYIATGDSHLYALDAKTGKLKWKLRLPGWASMSSPHIKDDILYVGALDKLVAVDLKRQKIIWKQGKLGSVTDVPPAVAGNTVIVTGAKMNLQLNKKQLWEKYGENMPNMAFEITQKEKRIYGDDAENYHFIYAFDNKTGKLLWKDLMGTGPDQKVPIPHTNTSGAVTIDGEYAFVGSPYTKSLMAYHIPTGNKVWEHNAGEGIKGAPAVKDGQVYAGDVKGNLYVLQASNGKLLNKIKLGGPLSPGGPVIINETLFIGSQDYNVYAKPLKSLLP